MQDKFNYSYDLPSFSSCWQRLTDSTDIRNQSTLAKLVGKTDAYISKMKKKDIFLPEWAYFVCLKYNVSIDWLLTGGKHDNRNDNSVQEGYSFSVLREIDEWLESLTSQEPKRADWFLVSFQDAFPMFREWKKRRDKEESEANSDPKSSVA